MFIQNLLLNKKGRQAGTQPAALTDTTSTSLPEMLHSHESRKRLDTLTNIVAPCLIVVSHFDLYRRFVAHLNGILEWVSEQSHNLILATTQLLVS
tara:strand:+ start:520 stop:804 length:285 start_codon:yes stop_codon:yes gene_type:complete